MALIDPKHPFFAPAWRRWATVVLPLIWTAVEIATNSPGWAILFGVMGVYAFYVLIWTFPVE